MSIAIGAWPPRLAFTVDESVFVSGVSKRQINLAIASGELPSALVAGRRRIAPIDLAAWLRGEPMPVKTSAAH